MSKRLLELWFELTGEDLTGGLLKIEKPANEKKAMMEKMNNMRGERRNE